MRRRDSGYDPPSASAASASAARSAADSLRSSLTTAARACAVREEGLGREAAAGEGWCAGSVSHLGIDALLGQPDQHCERLSVEPRLQQLREVVQGCAARRREVSGGGAGGAGIARARLAMRHRPYRLVCPCPHACRREGKQENAVSGIPRCVFYVPPLGETQSAEPTLGDPWYMALVRPRTPQGQGSLLPAAARPRASGPLGALLYTLAPRPCLGVRLPTALQVLHVRHGKRKWQKLKERGGASARAACLSLSPGLTARQQTPDSA